MEYDASTRMLLFRARTEDGMDLRDSTNGLWIEQKILLLSSILWWATHNFTLGTCSYLRYVVFVHEENTQPVTSSAGKPNNTNSRMAQVFGPGCIFNGALNININES